MNRKFGAQSVVVWLLIAAYLVFFAANSIQIHNALQTHTADLGQIDLAVWNTSRGRFVQEIKGDELSTRLTDHVEPIWAPIGLIFWLWDDVRALLVAQTLALALGAWPLYLLARRRLQRPDSGGRAGWAPVLLVAIYLLFPALEAANLTEVHAIPFAVPLILCAFWFIESGQWGRFAAAALLLAAVKEEAALLAAVLGLYAAWQGRRWTKDDGRRTRNPEPGTRNSEPGTRNLEPLIGLAVVALSLAWFAVATFVIIPAHAAEAYGAAESTYFQRYGALGDSSADILRALITRPGEVWAIATTPGRVRYLLGLLLSTGGLALLGPEILLLSAPILLANLLSAFQAQWSGELHYSAPLVPYFMVAAVVGFERLTRIVGRRRRVLGSGFRVPGSSSIVHRPSSSVLLAALALLISLAFHTRAGWTPIGRNFRWPEITPHARLLPRFLTQIPADAPVAATTALVPHLSHRPFIFKLPHLGKAEWVLADVSGTTDMHPAALQEQLLGLLAAGWSVVDAADGYLLLAHRPGPTSIPDAFYDFARADPTILRLDVEANAKWPGGTTYLGYRLDDQPKWGLTRITHYLGVGEVSLSPYFAIAAADGSLADDSIQRPPPALRWYPPDRWRPGEILAFSSAWFLPDLWRPAIAFAAAAPNPSPAADPSHRIPPPAVANTEIANGMLWLPAWQRPGPRQLLRPLAAAPAIAPTQSPPPGGATVWMQSAPARVGAGAVIEFRLGWRPDATFTKDYTIFVHWLDANDQRLAQADVAPADFFPKPTSTWPARQATFTGHRLALPANLPPGAYTLVVGLYDPVTFARVPIAAPGGLPTDALPIAQLTIPRSDAQ